MSKETECQEKVPIPAFYEDIDGNFCHEKCSLKGKNRISTVAKPSFNTSVHSVLNFVLFYIFILEFS